MKPGGGSPQLGRPEVERPGLALHGAVPVAVPVAKRRRFIPLVVASAEDGVQLLFHADLGRELGRPANELPQGVASEPGFEILSQYLLHLDTRWYSLHGVGPPFSISSGWSG